MDDYGMAMTRDVIAAADWILANKHLYNIRVASFSLHSAAPASVFFDPLDRAVEKLWFNGVVVVAAAGNYGVDGSASGVTFAPGNDPFVITVGAADINRTVRTTDDFLAALVGVELHARRLLQAQGLGAPGRYIIAAVPWNATLMSERPANVKPYNTMELSGTSFSAPIWPAPPPRVAARQRVDSGSRSGALAGRRPGPPPAPYPPARSASAWSRRGRHGGRHPALARTRP